MTIEEIKKEIENCKYWDWMYQMADRYTPEERKARDENERKLYQLRAKLEEMEQGA